MRKLTGPDNPNWKGGRIVEPRGYVLIRVGVGHPLADCRGYAYEHRLKAEAGNGELVHHANEIKGDNSDKNLIKTTRRLHLVHHRKPDSNLRKPEDENLPIKCACGCGATFLRYDNCGFGRPRRFLPGHNPHNSPTADAILGTLISGPKHREEIVSAIPSLSRRAVFAALSKLKRKQLVRNSDGRWERIAYAV
jgi:hypothetical protein